MLVAAVLRPEQREDRELEVVGVASEEGADALVLPVGQAEGAMERLLRHAAQRLESRGHPAERLVPDRGSPRLRDA